MRTALLTSTLLFAACTEPPPASTPQPEPAAPVGTASLAVCAAGDGVLGEDWAVDNGHGAVSALSVGPTGSAALAGADSTVKLWDVASGALAWTSGEPAGAGYGSEFAGGTQGPLTELAFDASGSALLGGDAFGTVAVFAPESGLLLASWLAGTQAVTGVASAYDSALVVTSTAAFGGELSVWSASGELQVGPLDTELWGVDALLADPTAEQIIAIGHDYGEPAIEVRSAAFPTAVLANVTLSGTTATFRAAAPLGDGFVLAGGDDVLALIDWMAEPGAQVRAQVVVAGGGIVSVHALDDEHFAAATADGRVLLGTIDDLAITAELAVGAIAGLSVVPGGWQLVITGDDGVLRLLGCEG